MKYIVAILFLGTFIFAESGNQISVGVLRTFGTIQTINTSCYLNNTPYREENSSETSAYYLDNKGFKKYIKISEIEEHVRTISDSINKGRKLKEPVRLSERFGMDICTFILVRESKSKSEEDIKTE